MAESYKKRMTSDGEKKQPKGEINHSFDHIHFYAEKKTLIWGKESEVFSTSSPL